MVQTLSGEFDTVLEIACGSARDSLFLQTMSKNVVASDSNSYVISELESRFQNIPGIKFCVEDALSLSFEDRQFDVSFHNGFYVCFDDDEIIKAMLREQCRVTRKHIFFFVHSGHNWLLRNKFHREARADHVFDVRFFRCDEIERLVHESGVTYKQMRIYKFGGFVDRFLAERLKGLPNPVCGLVSKNLRLLYSLTPLHAAERLVCHLTL